MLEQSQPDAREDENLDSTVRQVISSHQIQVRIVFFNRQWQGYCRSKLFVGRAFANSPIPDTPTSTVLDIVRHRLDDPGSRVGPAFVLHHLKVRGYIDFDIDIDIRLRQRSKGKAFVSTRSILGEIR